MTEGARFFGWEVADAAALDELASRLERAKVDVLAEPRALADTRRVGGLISFRDPAGNRLEAFYGASSTRRRSAQGVRFPASAPALSASAMPC
jgi:hypothetical protein